MRTFAHTRLTYMHCFARLLSKLSDEISDFTKSGKPGESYLVAFTEAALLLRPLPAPQQNTAYNTRNI